MPSKNHAWSSRFDRRNILINFLLTTSTFQLIRASADAHRRDDLSFRGPVPDDSRIPHWDLSGSAHRLPSAKDFIRLHHPYPFAYGAMFTDKPIPFDQWSVEIGFRIHGGFSNIHHGHHKEAHPHEEHPSAEEDMIGKGGRGFAFWYSKSANPTPVVFSANAKHQLSPPPALSVEPFPDPLDDSVSFFGGHIDFHGLAVVVDNQPSTPLTRRSDRKHWGPDDAGVGSEEWAVISGVIDNGKGHQKWIEDRTRSELDESEEAAYLNHTVGDCQVALRNAAGLIWMKITHVADTLTVSLDLTPHTTLSGEERHYRRDCFTASNVKLPKGYYMGLTGLASPSDEADNIDIYAVEVKEIKGKAKTEEDVKEHIKEEHVAADDVKLEGTGKTKDPNVLAFEALNSQKNWAESVQKMMQKLDALKRDDLPSNDRSDHTPSHHGSGGHTALDSQLTAINTKLDSIVSKLDKIHSPGMDDSEKNKLLQKIYDLEEQSNRHEMFLSEQIEEVRHLILNPPAPNYEDKHHFKPLEHQHDEIPNDSHHSSSPFAERFEHERHTKKNMSMLKFLSWIFGSIIVLFGLYKAVKMVIKKTSKDHYGSDESNYFLNPSNGASGGFGNSALSTTLDTFGFRQRSKKMI